MLPNTYKEFFVGDINESNFLLLYGEIYQPLKDLYNSMNQYFPDDQCIILQNTLCISKRSIQKCNINQWILKLRGYIFIDRILDSINLTSFLFLSFGMLLYNIHSYLNRLPKYCSLFQLSLWGWTSFIYLNPRNMLQQTECPGKLKNSVIDTNIGIKKICKNVS